MLERLAGRIMNDGLRKEKIETMNGAIYETDFDFVGRKKTTMLLVFPKTTLTIPTLMTTNLALVDGKTVTKRKESGPWFLLPLLRPP